MKRNWDFVTFFSKHSVVFIDSASAFLRLDPNKVSDSAEKSKLISFSRQQYVDKSHGKTGAPCLTVNQIIFFSSSLGLKWPQTYTCDCCSWLEQKARHPNTPRLNQPFTKRPKASESLKVHNPNHPFLISWVSHVDAGAQRYPPWNTHTLMHSQGKWRQAGAVGQGSPTLSSLTRGSVPAGLSSAERRMGSSGPSRLQCCRLEAFLSGQCLSEVFWLPALGGLANWCVIWADMRFAKYFERCRFSAISEDKWVYKSEQHNAKHMSQQPFLSVFFNFLSLATVWAISEANHILIYSALIDILKVTFLFLIWPFITSHTGKKGMSWCTGSGYGSASQVYQLSRNKAFRLG